jgi:hypothetical protein
MKEERCHSLSRDELALIGFYRSLSSQKQFDILGSAEAAFNSASRLRELSSREIEKQTFPPEEFH